FHLRAAGDGEPCLLDDRVDYVLDADTARRPYMHERWLSLRPRRHECDRIGAGRRPRSGGDERVQKPPKLLCALAGPFEVPLSPRLLTPDVRAGVFGEQLSDAVSHGVSPPGADGLCESSGRR